MSSLTEAVQVHADAEHERQPVCSWCSVPGQPYEYRGVRFDGLTACQGERLCEGCTSAYLEATPALIRSCRTPDDPGILYDLNRATAAWSEQNVPGCRGEVPVQAIAAAYRYADWEPPRRGHAR